MPWLFGAFQKVGVDFGGIPGSLGSVVVKCFGFGSFGMVMSWPCISGCISVLLFQAFHSTNHDLTVHLSFTQENGQE